MKAMNHTAVEVIRNESEKHSLMPNLSSYISSLLHPQLVVNGISFIRGTDFGKCKNGGKDFATRYPIAGLAVCKKKSHAIVEKKGAKQRTQWLE